MSTTYRTRMGERLDWICYQHYGDLERKVETVLEANRGLAAYGPELPGNLIIMMPDIESTPVASTISLWD